MLCDDITGSQRPGWIHTLQEDKRYHHCIPGSLHSFLHGSCPARACWLPMHTSLQLKKEIRCTQPPQCHQR